MGTMAFIQSLWFMSVMIGGALVEGQVQTQTINRSGSVKPYGVCRAIHPEMKPRSHWCKRGALYGEPSHPSLKYGRQTVYAGPIGIHRGWCGRHLKGDNSAAGVAISTKYINLKSVSPHSPYCGQCVCIRIVGADLTSNRYPPKEAANYFGKILKGRVEDLCPECEDDHIDILADRPYTFGPVDKYNPMAARMNSIPPTTRIVPRNIAYGVGIWRVEWQFASCNTNCNNFFSKMPMKRTG